MKNLIIIFSFLVCSASAQNITDSLLLYYPMNGNSNDLSGNNFHGTASGVTSVPDRYGVPNSAYYFDGVNDYIDFPLSNVLKPQFPLTIAFWTKLKQISISKCQFVNTDFVQNNYHGVWMNVNDPGHLGITFGGGLGGCNPQNRINYRATELPLDTGIWYHVTGIIHSATNMELYINCNNSAATFAGGTGPVNVAYSNNISGTIGRMDYQINGPAAQFWGYLDEISYWKRALSAAEVYTLCDSLPLMSSAPSWDCINNACNDPGNGSGMYTTLPSCQSFCSLPSTWNCIAGNCEDPADGSGVFSDSLNCISNCILPSWDCIANSCVDPGNGSGSYSSLSSCQSSCGTTSLDEFNVERKLLRIVDVLGRNAKKESNVPLFYFYDDGTVEKQIIIE
jgi:hypothetical protein